MGKINTLDDLDPTFDDWAEGRGGKSSNGVVRCM